MEKQQKELTYTGIAVGNLGKVYDEEAKKVFSDVGILARIMKGCVDECKALTIEEIITTIEGVKVSSAPVEQDMGRILSLNTEDSSISEGLIKYDVLFYAMVPNEKEPIKLIINLEAQNSLYPGYKLCNRAMYYIARLISSQKNTEFIHSEYDSLKKVYSIWLCYDAEGKVKPRVRVIHDAGREYDLLDSEYNNQWQENFYKAIMVNLGSKQGRVNVEYIDMLNTILDKDLAFDRKKKILEQEYGLVLSRKVEGGLKEMCNLSQGLAQSAWNKGVSHGISQGILQGKSEGITEGKMQVVANMLKTGKLSLIEIADYTGVSLEQVNRVSSTLNLNNQVWGNTVNIV